MKLLTLAAVVMASAGYTSAVMAYDCPATGNSTLDTAVGSMSVTLGSTTYNSGEIIDQNGDRMLCILPTSASGADAMLAADITVTVGRDDVTYPVLWGLSGILTVGNGQAQGATPSSADDIVLTIEAGTEVVGMVQNSALVITRGAKIEAYGSEQSPIVFSSFDEDYTGEGEWGGVILSGFGVANECTTSDSCLMEGISSNYYFGAGASSVPAGGEDGSGVLRYVVITEGGTQISTSTSDPVANGGNEINGLTLYGIVGYNNSTQKGTKIEYVHVNENLDDGIEFFGGDATVDHLWLTCNGDDSVDWDYGYHGEISNLAVIQKGTAADPVDHAMELAGNPNSDTATPLATGTIKTAYFKYVGDLANVDFPFKLKEGTDGYFNDIYLTGFEDTANSTAKNCFAVSSSNITSADFNNVDGDCFDNEGYLTGSPTVTSYPSSFWTAAPACE